MLSEWKVDRHARRLNEWRGIAPGGNTGNAEVMTRLLSFKCKGLGNGTVFASQASKSQVGWRILDGAGVWRDAQLKFTPELSWLVLV